MERAVPGASVATTPALASATASPRFARSRWSADTACSSAARREPPVRSSSSAWMRGMSFAFKPAFRIERDCGTLK